MVMFCFSGLKLKQKIAFFPHRAFTLLFHFSASLCCHSHGVHFRSCFLLQLKMLQARGEPVPSEHLWDEAAGGQTLRLLKVRTQSVLVWNVLPAPSTLSHREETESPVTDPSSPRCATVEGRHVNSWLSYHITMQNNKPVNAKTVTGIALQKAKQQNCPKNAT